MKLWLHAAVLAVVTSGCGGNEGPEDERFNLNRSAEVGNAEGLRGVVAGLNDAYRNEGVPGLRTEIQSAVENLEQFHEAEVGEQHRPTYEQIEQKVLELKTLVEGSPDQAAISEKLQEMNDLAAKLPKAEAPAAPQPAG